MDETRQLPGIIPLQPPPGRFAGAMRGGDPNRVVVAVGVALLTTAVVLSAFYTRARDNLDWSNYTMGLLATLGLLGIAAAGWLLARERDGSSDLVAWPGAFGAVAVGLMLGVALDDSAATEYVAGLAVVAISAGGYLLVRRDAFVTSAIGGLFVVYLQLCDDLFDFGDGGDNLALSVSAALFVFTVLVTVAGWWLPSRVLSGVLVGVLSVVGNVVILVVLGVAATFQAAFGLSNGRSPGVKRFDEYDNDVWFILVFALLLVVGWAVAAYLTGHVGFRLLIVAMCVSVVPVSAVVLAVQHPTWWEVVVGGLGGLLLVAVALSVHRRSPAASSTPPPPAI